jgi:hypothetical protein
MPIDDRDARNKATGLIRKLHNLRSRGMSETQQADEAESAIRTFAATYTAKLEVELEELRHQARQREDLLRSLQQMMQDREREG